MDNQQIAEEIIGLEKAAMEQWDNGNPSGFIALFSDDITYFDPFQEMRIDGAGNMVTFYESLRGKISGDRYEMLNPQVQVYGQVATLSYNMYSYSGEEEFRWNCTNVYRLTDDGRWRMFHNHWSFIRPMDMKQQG